MARSPFPLQWPDGFARTTASDRIRSRFGHRSSGQVSLSNARDTLLTELDRLGAANYVITSDLPVRNDGLPYADGRSKDPGIAAWFILDDQERVFACDRWLSHAENMMAIAKSIEAMRGLDRWGMADVVKRVIGGFNALPPGSDDDVHVPPSPKKRPWREVLGEGCGPWPELDNDELLVLARSRHRKLIKFNHPDAGGDVAIAAELNVALAEAEQELGG